TAEDVGSRLRQDISIRVKQVGDNESASSNAVDCNIAVIKPVEVISAAGCAGESESSSGAERFVEHPIAGVACQANLIVIHLTGGEDAAVRLDQHVVDDRFVIEQACFGAGRKVGGHAPLVSEGAIELPRRRISSHSETARDAIRSNGVE